MIKTKSSLEYPRFISNLIGYFFNKMYHHNIFFTKINFTLIFFTSFVCILEVVGQELTKITIEGKVLAEDKTPTPGVSIREKGTSNGTITDANGNYKFEVFSDAILIFSHVGYSSEEVSVNTNSVLDIVLTPDPKTLEEIVVMGYGVQEKKDVTGSAFALQSKNFNKGIIYSPEQLFQGKIPGVEVSSNSGEPGSDSFIRIRGANTIRANNTPLYVIDGYPLDITSLDPPTWNNNDSKPYSPLLFLNPDDIESINVLKDASAAAIYGSRGSNGVIIITTKKGSKNDQNSLSYNTYFGVSEIPEKIDVLSADEFRQAQEDYGFNNVYPDSTVHTDWQDEVFQTGYVQNHDLSFSGGSNTTNFRASLNYFNQDGIIKSSYLKRYSGRINAQHLAINDKLNIELTLAAGKTIHNQTGGRAAWDALITNPTMPVYDTYGNLFNPDVNQEERNPLFNLEKKENIVTTSKILTNLQTIFEIVEGFYLKLNGGLESSIATRRTNQDSKYVNGRSARIGQHESNSYLFESYLDYRKSLNQAGTFNAMVGYSFQHFQNRSFEFGAGNFDLEGARHIDMIRSGEYVDWMQQSSSHEQSKLQSLFARLIYNYKDRYLLTTNYRMDGSSRFGEDYRYAHFPSIALGWRISNESFLNSQQWINDLKIRGSWGITGNQEIPNKISQLLVGSPFIQGLPGNSNAILDASGQTVKGYTVVRTPNPDLKWEETTQWNIALDFEILNQRLQGSVEYFHKKTEDFLMQEGVFGAPFRTMWTNVQGNLYNIGWEVFLSANVIRSTFSWNISLSYTRLQNYIDGLSAPIPVGSFWGAEIFQQLMNDQPVGTFYGPVFLGFDEKGNSQYVTDESNMPIDDVIGHGMPDYYGGITNEFSYKGFDLSFMFNGSYGNHVFSTNRRYKEEKYKFSWGQNIRTELLNNGESFSNQSIYSSRFVEDGSFIRLNYLTFGYSFNVSKLSWLNQLRLYLTGNNLLLFTSYSGYDPEMNILVKESLFGIPPIGIDFAGYPKARSIQIGLNITF